jgi:cyclopropane fatty-acyl-phospholipid synthase-like methyltransferase
MSARLSTGYFDRIYSESEDPWQLDGRWYEQRKYAITLALLPYRRYRHAFEPGCSIGVLTEQLTSRCDHVTSTDIASAALDATHRRLVDAGKRRQVTLLRQSVDEPWPRAAFDLVVLSELCYYLHAEMLRDTLDREIPLLRPGTTVVAAHWRHPVAEYPISGGYATDVIAATSQLHHLGGYRDEDMIVEVFDTGSAMSVAARTGVPGA